jgi:hypothetical protein
LWGKKDPWYIQVLALLIYSDKAVLVNIDSPGNGSDTSKMIEIEGI